MHETCALHTLSKTSNHGPGLKNQRRDLLLRGSSRVADQSASNVSTLFYVFLVKLANLSVRYHGIMSCIYVLLS